MKLHQSTSIIRIGFVMDDLGRFGFVSLEIVNAFDQTFQEALHDVGVLLDEGGG